MSRRIITAIPYETRGENLANPDIKLVPQPVPDDFLGRVIKYIPTEIVGLFIAVRGVIPATASPDLLWFIAGVAWLLVPLYFWVVTKQGGEPPMLLQIVFATIAFPIWIFAMGGAPASSWPWYNAHSYVASVVLIFVTVIFGWFEPKPGS